VVKYSVATEHTEYIIARETMIIRTQEETTLRIQELHRIIEKAKGKEKEKLQLELDTLRDEQIKQLKDEFKVIDTQVDAVPTKVVNAKPMTKTAKLRELVELNRKARELVTKTTLLKRAIRGQ
jgi:hypothetical protein